MSSSGADSEGETVIPADGESLSSATAFLFAFISLAIYLLFLRPTTNGNNNNATTQTSQQHQQTQARAANRGPVAIPNRARRAAGGNNNNTDVNSTPGRPPNSLAGRQAARAQRPLCDAAAEMLETCKATPPHFKPSTTTAASFSQVKIGGTNVLIDGLVAFSHTRASSLPSPPSSSQPGTAGTVTESDGAEDAQQTARRLRQDRAKILSRLFANCSGVTASAGGAVPTPPPKGSTLVVGLSWDQTGSDTVSRVLDILATYYTVMVMVEVVPSHASAGGGSGIGGIRGGSDGYKGEKSLHEEVVARLRGSSCGAGIGGNATSQSNSSSSGGGRPGRRTLSEAVLPSHRILLASSVTGRVALVRQLASVELVVDYHPDVRNGLERFGYRVSLVSDWASTFASLSSSGSSSDAASSTLTTTRTQ